jgi:hypothetical protein
LPDPCDGGPGRLATGTVATTFAGAAGDGTLGATGIGGGAGATSTTTGAFASALARPDTAAALG